MHEAFKDFATQDFPIDRFYPVVKVNSQSSSEAILRATSSDSDAFYFPTQIPATAPVYNPTPLNLKDNKLQTYIWGPIACQIVWLGVNVTTPLCCITLVESILKNGVKYQIINLSICNMFHLYLVFVIFVTIIVTEVLEFLDREHGNLFSINTIELFSINTIEF